MSATDVEALWDGLRHYSFDDDFTAARKQCEKSGKRVFSASEVHGINEVRAHISSNWTVNELRLFVRAWDGLPPAEKYRVMGGLPEPTDPRDAKAWDAHIKHSIASEWVRNFDACLHGLLETALLAVGAKCYVDCKRGDARIALALDCTPYYKQTIADLCATLPPPLAARIQKGFDEMEPVKAGVRYLVGKKARLALNGKKAQEQAKIDPAIADAMQRAADDMEKALRRVADDPGVKAVKHRAVLTACRRLCDWTDKRGNLHPGKFKPLTTKRNSITGEFLYYAPLKDWQGKPIKPETLAKRFREKYGTARERKARAKKRGNR